MAHVFAEVKRLAGLADVHCALVEQPPQPEFRVAEMVALQRDGSVLAGNFGLESNVAAITHYPAIAAATVKLVAVLAHELSHQRLLGFSDKLQVGRDANERAADAATLAMSFGLCGAQWAFTFERHQDPFSQGW